LQVRKSTVAIASGQFELSKAQQSVFGLWRQWVIDYQVLVITFRVGCIRSKRRSPEQSLRI
jgi:hypothetical protein